MPNDALKRIEARHKTGGEHELCIEHGEPCDVVKLARALDAIRDGARWGMAHDQIVERVERVLNEVARGSDD